MAIGVAFVVIVALMAASIVLPLRSSSDFIRVAEKLSETKEFLNNYPNANTTVYFITTCVDDPCLSLARIPSIVEYWYNADDKIALLRISIDRDNGPGLVQASCQLVGTEESGEIHSSRIAEGLITQFLQGEYRCPTRT
jgi:hypothetical protein